MCAASPCDARARPRPTGADAQNYPDGEIAEMVQLFVQRGMDRYDADDVIRTMAKYKVRAAHARLGPARRGVSVARPSQEFFVNLMMTEELSLPLPSHVQYSVRTSALMCAARRPSCAPRHASAAR